MTRLTNEERETIITFDETPADGFVFTYNRAWQSHLEKRLGLKPVMDNGFGGKEYQIAKSRIRMPLAPRKLSPEQRQKLGERLRRARLQKSPDSSPANVITMKSKGQMSGRDKNTPTNNNN
jgi:hypothetical protein